jgi:hypothetical protein
MPLDCQACHFLEKIITPPPPRQVDLKSGRGRGYRFPNGLPIGKKVLPKWLLRTFAPLP